MLQFSESTMWNSPRQDNASSAWSAESGSLVSRARQAGGLLAAGDMPPAAVLALAPPAPRRGHQEHEERRPLAISGERPVRGPAPGRTSLRPQLRV